MAPIDKKRKSGPTNESFARSRKPAEEENRPSKRLRQDGKDENKITTPKVALVPKIAKAREEDVAFPRGGASVLTPLEHKQIQIEATRDVLFEQGAKTTKSNEDGTVDEGPDRKKHKFKSKGKNKGKKTEDSAPEEENVKIEGLSYKVPSQLLLCYSSC
jgi:rRNA biogenesis protein RRP5